MSEGGEGRRGREGRRRNEGEMREEANMFGGHKTKIHQRWDNVLTLSSPPSPCPWGGRHLWHWGTSPPASPSPCHRTALQTAEKSECGHHHGHLYAQHIT